MTKEGLWPFGKRAALLSVPVIWVLLSIAVLLSNRYLNWPDISSAKVIVPIVVLLGLIPLALMVLDFAASSRAVLDVKGIKIDFSQRELGSQMFGLPDNIGIPGTSVSDSSPMQITSALEEATRSEVALLDLKEGGAWWVTRLFALCAGAVRAGTPKAIVFLGTRENATGVFLGWAEPAPVLRALLNDKPEYRSAYQHATGIARQTVAFEGINLLPSPLSLHSDVNRYAQNEYVQLGDAAFEQILMDQLALKYEHSPDRLTLGRLQQLFEHCLYRDFIDLKDSGEEQVLALLSAKGRYIALMRQGRYEGLLKAEVGQRIILQQLFSQASKTS